MCSDCSSPVPAGNGDPDGPSRRDVLKGLGLSGLGLATLTSGLSLATLGLDVPSASAAAPDPALLTLRPSIRPRASWAGASCPVRGRLAVEVPGDVRFLLVHHTDSPGNDYTAQRVPELLRGMYRYHVGPDKGWADLAYNFLVDRYGGIWEGRAGSLQQPVVPGATGGSQGFSQLGCFVGNHSRTPPTPQAQASMISLLAWLSRKYGVDTAPAATTTFVSRGSNRWPAGRAVKTRTIEGHRSMSMTTCPGDAAYPLVLNAFPKGVRRLNGPLPTTDRTAWCSAPGTVLLAERRSDASVALRTVALAPGIAAVPPVALGGSVLGAPLVVQRPGGPLEVLARGTDDRLWVTSHAEDGTWTAWAPVGGPITGPPAAALTGTGLQLFARGADGSLVVRTSAEPGVHAGAWTRLGGRLLPGSAPAATRVTEDRTEVVVHGTDGVAYHGSLTGGAWSGLRSLGGTHLVGSPSAVAAAGQLVVVSVRRTGLPYARTLAAGWSRLGGAALFGSAALAAAPDGSRADAFGTGTDGVTYRNARVGTTWSGWSSLGA